jgi:N-ethylmaleimide reductase
MNFPHLFSPLQIGPYRLKHRLVLAPLTRMRAAKPSLAPRPLNAEYYAQRATQGGLLIAEASPVSATAFGNPGVPGIYTQDQIAGWRKVVDAVHARGGIVFLQLWHVGRVSHSSFQPGGALPVAPSAVAISQELKTSTADGKVTTYETPRALETSEIPGIIDAFRQAATNALAAGFDGVEVHGANGYLLEQFIKDGANTRTDAYGGSIENRARLLLEVTAAVVKEIGAERTGVRLSPVSPAGAISCSDPQSQYDYIAEQLSALGIAYLHVVEGATGGSRDVAPFDFDALRTRFKNPYLANNGYDLDLANTRLVEGKADLFVFGRPFISNPDLVERLEIGAPLAPLNPATLYGGGAQGYIDYPTFADSSIR